MSPFSYSIALGQADVLLFLPRVLDKNKQTNKQQHKKQQQQKKTVMLHNTRSLPGNKWII